MLDTIKYWIESGLLLIALSAIVFVIIAVKLLIRRYSGNALETIAEPLQQDEPSPYYLKLEIDEILYRLRKLEAAQSSINSFQKDLYAKYPTLKKDTASGQAKPPVRKKRSRRRSNGTSQAPTPQNQSGK